MSLNKINDSKNYFIEFDLKQIINLYLNTVDIKENSFDNHNKIS